MQTDIHGLPYVKDLVPMPKVKPTKGGDISEPVFAIAETMRKYPSRFKIKVYENLIDVACWIIKDTKTTQIIVVGRENAIWDDDYNIVDWHYRLSWDWLTKDECDFLVTEFKAIQEIKSLRRHSITRAKFKGFYK
jgi:hypothetical protein